MSDQSLHPSNLEPRTSRYRGRFAPTPSGSLHFGSLIAAAGSYLQAKARQGEWLLRIDDIDPPREVAGASDAILTTLERFGFEWDGPVTYQSSRHELYQDALDSLQTMGKIYPCACSRKIIAEAQALSSNKNTYPGTCRKGLSQGQSARMLRMNTQGIVIDFDDLIQGHCKYDLETAVGDYVVLRVDGLFGYQLATGVDDATQGINEVVRGRDLLDSTPCQILIQQGLGLESPAYCHLPVALNKSGQKLSKQHHANPLSTNRASSQLWQALTFLGQKPPKEQHDIPLSTLWEWAIANWQVDNIPKQQTNPLSGIALT